MKKILTLLILLTCIINAKDKPSLLFDGGINALLVNQDFFYIEVNDQVTGGCLPNPKRLKDKMEISLRKNGFKIAQKSNPLFSSVIISAVGFKVGSSSCAINISADLLFPIIANAPYSDGNITFATYPYRLGSVILTGTKYSMQNRLEKQVTEFGDKLYLDISRAKDYIFEKFPFIKENMTKNKNKLKETNR